MSDKPPVFETVRSELCKLHVFETPWHATIATLAVLESQTALRIGRVFHVSLAGPAGSGKTDLMNAMLSICGGLSVTNTSVAVLVRRLKKGLPVFIDEFGDSDERSERTRMVELMLRVGYRDDPTAVYSRCEGRDNRPVDYPVFGLKVFAHRSAVEHALDTRAFTLELHNAKRGRLPRSDTTKNAGKALKAWGRSLHDWTPKRLLETSNSPEFIARLRAILGDEYGANRPTELTETALLISLMADVDVDSDIKLAVASMHQKEDTDVELSAILKDALRAAIGMPEICQVRDGWARILHKDVLSVFNMHLMGIHLRPVDSVGLSVIRKEAGIKSDWLGMTDGRSVWRFPVSILEEKKEP